MAIHLKQNSGLKSLSQFSDFLLRLSVQQTPQLIRSFINKSVHSRHVELQNRELLHYRF